MDSPYRFINEELEDMTDDEFLALLYSQFGYGMEYGFTVYEIARMNILLELTKLLRREVDKSPILKRALYLAEVEEKCLSLDMAEPLEPKLAQAC